MGRLKELVELVDSLLNDLPHVEDCGCVEWDEGTFCDYHRKIRRLDRIVEKYKGDQIRKGAKNGKGS